MRPTLFLDSADRLLVYGRSSGVIRADAPDGLPHALAAMEDARTAGRHLAGYFSYELGYALEPRLASLMPATRPMPLLWFGVFDAPEILEDSQIEAALATWREGRAYAGPLSHEWDARRYDRGFAQAKALIAAGDIYQVNLTFRSRFPFTGDPLTLYAGLRALAGARHAAYVNDGTRSILSLSPELFFDLTAEGVLTARPMKGTAARGLDPAADARARAALAQSGKDRAENLMIVDLLRNDLGRIASVGSVEVRDLFAVETYPTLHQMVSTVTAKLNPGTGIEALVRALFPCGSVTGAPKIRAMEIIAALEESPRGLYCGAIGHFAPGGAARFNVPIRTLTISDGCGELGIGGAVVQDSVSESEYAECLLKARYFERGRRPLALIETLRFSPAEGFVRLERHLARMGKSAAMLGLLFDRQAGQAALTRAAEGAACDLRLRLLLEEGGAISCTAAPLGQQKPEWTYAIAPCRVAADALSRHKTDWRQLYDEEHSRLARITGCDEVLFLNTRGELAEGSRTSLFLSRAGKLLTPPLDSGALDGVLRRELIEEGRCEEAVLRPEDLAAGNVFLGNSLRGLIRARPV